MRISLLVVAASAALLLTSGCATDKSMAKQSPFDDNIDYVKVNRVDAQAQRSGHQIVWVNLPTKKYRQSRSEQVGIN